ncbi:MAG: tetratricopeptide repeat protein [Planctomycetota bacterium]|nr:tetratricopeptide repeat protein [Planctomycetota bacterium]
MNVTAQLKQALEHHQAGRLDPAAEMYRTVLQYDPENPHALHLLGMVLHQTGHATAAIELIQRAIGGMPDNPVFHNNLGIVLRATGNLVEASQCYQRALTLKPDYAEAHYNLGNVHQDLNRIQAAIDSFEQALKLRPGFADALNNLAVAAKNLGELDKAFSLYRQLIEIRPDAISWNNLGDVLWRRGEIEEAIVCFRTALKISPDDAAVHGNLLYYMKYDAQADPTDVFAEHVRWGQRFDEVPPREFENVRDPDRPLRIGYVSPSLCRNPVAYFLEGILRHQDPSRVQSWCFSDANVTDNFTERLRSLADGWHDTRQLSDGELAERILETKIDILVDLAGHTSHNRLSVFAKRPAPIQVTYLGYPDTTGLKAMDYRLTDAVADPAGEFKRHTEELIRLRDCFCCYSPPESPAVARLPASALGHITFGSLHNLGRLNRTVLETWCRILDAIPDSRLVMFRDTLHGKVRTQFLKKFAEHGISANRVDLRHGVADGSAYLSHYSDIDITLDTFPWGGHTTACESLWMGVPVLTLRGQAHAGRMVASVLSVVGLADWIADDLDDYVSRAVRFASDVPALSRNRSAMRQHIARSALCDGAAFTRNLESIYCTMWRKWCQPVDD